MRLLVRLLLHVAGTPEHERGTDHGSERCNAELLIYNCYDKVSYAYAYCSVNLYTGTD